MTNESDCFAGFLRPTAALIAVLMLPGPLLAGAGSAEQSPPDSSTGAAPPHNDPLVDRQLLLGFLADPGTLALIDARSPGEFAEQHIPGAINVPHDQLDAHADLLPDDTSQSVVVYCRSGKRAGLLRDQLLVRGFEDVRVLPPRQIFQNDEVMVFNCGLDTGGAVTASPVNDPKPTQIQARNPATPDTTE